MEEPGFAVRKADGRRLDAFLYGPESGELIVAHHGTPGTGQAIYPPYVEIAAKLGFRLAAYSRPGYGNSDRVEGRRVADAAADAAALADALGAERFFSVGSSGGGPHSLACAALLPDRVIAGATIAGVAPLGVEGIDWSAGMGRENLDELAAYDAGPDALREYIDREAAKLGALDGEDVMAALGDLVSEADQAVLTGEYAQFVAEALHLALANGIWGWFDDDVALLGDWGFDLHGIEVPVHVWQGGQDRMVPAQHGNWLAANIAGATPHLLAEHGHLSLALGHYEQILDQLRRR